MARDFLHFVVQRLGTWSDMSYAPASLAYIVIYFLLLLFLCTLDASTLATVLNE